MKLNKHRIALLALGTIGTVLWCQSLSVASHHTPAHVAAAPHHESHAASEEPSQEDGDCPIPDCGRAFIISAHSPAVPAPAALNTSVDLVLRTDTRHIGFSRSVDHNFALHENDPPNNSLVHQAVLIRI